MFQCNAMQDVSSMVEKVEKVAKNEDIVIYTQFSFNLTCADFVGHENGNKSFRPQDQFAPSRFAPSRFAPNLMPRRFAPTP